MDERGGFGKIEISQAAHALFYKINECTLRHCSASRWSLVVLSYEGRQAVAQSARDGNENNLLGVEADPRVIAVGVCTWMRQKGWPFYYVHGMAGWLVAI